MLCCSMRMNPLRGLSSSETNVSTMATVNGTTSMASKNLCRMLYPTTKQVNADINIR